MSFALVRLSDGATALIEGGPNASSVEWLMHGATIVVLGPTGTFSKTSALSVANLVAAAGK